MAFQRRRAASIKTRIETPFFLQRGGTERDVAGRHPSKQGLKQTYFWRVRATKAVAGRHPSKQGLKQVPLNIAVENPQSRRAASIKTRIETCSKRYRSCIQIICRRAASIKTRIETSYHRDVGNGFYMVAGRHPSKQGLKLYSYYISTYHGKSQGGIHQNKD